MSNDTKAPPNQPTLRCVGLSFDYGSRKALDSVSFSIDPGETVVLLGPNGAGKSTLFSLISGLFSTTRGTITINGSELNNQASTLAQLGIVFQLQTLDMDLTVKQNLAYFCSLQGLSKSTAQLRIDEALTRLDLTPRAHDKIRTLNGGHRRRVEIARATLHAPKLLLLDEPTVGLDIPTRTELINHLHSLPEQTNCAVLWATHLADEIANDDRVIILHQGQIVEDGKCQSLLEKHAADDLSDVMRIVMHTNESGASIA